MSVPPPASKPDPSFGDHKRELLRDLILRAKANPDDPAVVDLVVTLFGGLLGEIRTASDSLRRLADTAEASATHLSSIARELAEARVYRERERRHGR